jgi:hypothetical protein
MKNLYQYLLLTVFLLGASRIFAQVPVLNSYPSAPAVIFLDFDGQAVTGSSWNVNGPLYLGPSNMSDVQITEVFNRVAEDYRPFNINITTDSTKYWAAPLKQRMRVVLTTSWEWYGRAGGVAYVNSFTWGDNTPCFVFSSLLGYNTKNVAEAAAHEAGHTLGLRHQSRYDPVCAKTEEYNSGNGSGEIGWAPIMGVGYYRNQTTWHNGPNPYGCTNAQDDIAIITRTANGISFRSDDHDATSKNATRITMSNGRFTNEGVINNSTDEDMFEIAMPTVGKLKMDIAPNSVGAGDAGSNLDASVKLYNSKLQLINTFDQPEVLGASIDTTLNAGTYFFSVSGTSNANTADYASVGGYSIAGSYGTFTTLPVRKLELKGTADGSAHKLNWVIDADEAIVHQVVEVSSTGRDFQPVAEPASGARAFSYLPKAASVLQYRLNLTFDNGRQYYSNTIALRNVGKTEKPQLYTNLIRTGSIMLTSPSVFSYTIRDYSGREVFKGVSSQGASAINISNLTAGSYLIVFFNGQDQYVEKFVKQ